MIEINLNIVFSRVNINVIAESFCLYSQNDKINVEKNKNSGVSTSITDKY